MQQPGGLIDQKNTIIINLVLILVSDKSRHHLTPRPNLEQIETDLFEIS